MPQTDALTRYVLTLLALVLTVLVLYFGRSLILLLFVSAIFTFLFLPLARRMERAGMPRWTGALAATAILVLAVLGLFFFMGWQLSRFAGDLPALQAALTEKGNGFMQWLEDSVQIRQRDQIKWFNAQVAGLAGSGGRVAMQVAAGAGSTLGSIVPIPIFVFLLLLLKHKFRVFLVELGKDRGTDALGMVVRISELSRSYLRGVLLVMLILGTLNSIGFLALGLPYAVLLGFIMALLNIIPYVGALVGSLIPVLVAFITKDSFGYVLATMGVCLLSQFLDNNFITPKVVGSSVSINPLASVVALIAAGLLWGVVGMVVAIPMTGMLKLICEAVPGLRVWGYLLGEEKEFAPSNGKGG